MQRHVREQLLAWPAAQPFAGGRLSRISQLPREIERGWPRATPAWLRDRQTVEHLPIDHNVPAAGTRGGQRTARRILTRFVASGLSRYHEAHRHPDEAGTSRLSPYLHFGHLSVHEIFDAVMKRERWSARKLAPQSLGRREGWWGLSPGAER
jgi:deoxyribodipyrimidine photo-lyase